MGGFIVFLLIMALAFFLIWVGYRLARDHLADDKEAVDTQRQVLDAEWTALEQTRRVNDVFYRARDAMRRAEGDATHQERRYRS
jgi:cell division protein FtsL